MHELPRICWTGQQSSVVAWPAGRPWGSLIHVNKTAAAGVVMGGVLGTPKANSEPMALQNLKLGAQAITTAITQTERNLLGKDSKCLVRTRSARAPPYSTLQPPALTLSERSETPGTLL